MIIVSLVMRYSLILISAILILSSCNSHGKTKQLINSIDPIDSTKLLIQKEKENIFSDLAKSLKLLPINKGVDSFELRLWVDGMFVEHDLMTLTFKNKLWESHKFRYIKVKTE